MSLLLTQYLAEVAKGELIYDPAQEAILLHFEQIAQKLCEWQRPWRWRKAPSIKGLYLYGTVGSGKTFLLDLFYQYLPIEQKKRFHLHHFLKLVDDGLRALQGQSNPLQRLAGEWAKTTRVLCFDEFIVDDIAHAMILAHLLDALINAGVVLIATSNIPPRMLYLGGLQRARFLPAIDLIEQHCEVLSLSAQRDYRSRHDDFYPSYYVPCSLQNESLMELQFKNISSDYVSNQEIVLLGRRIPYLKKSEQAIWFDFEVLCTIPRSQLDYLELARLFKVIFISRLPVLSDARSVNALLLMHLVDVMYDAKRRLVICAETELQTLYPHPLSLPTFERTLSRLVEMQSTYYQAQCLSS